MAGLTQKEKYQRYIRNRLISIKALVDDVLAGIEDDFSSDDIDTEALTKIMGETEAIRDRLYVKLEEAETEEACQLKG